MGGDIYFHLLSTVYDFFSLVCRTQNKPHSSTCNKVTKSVLHKLQKYEHFPVILYHLTRKNLFSAGQKCLYVDNILQVFSVA